MLKSLIPPGKSLQFYAAISWLVPSVIAGLTCVFVFIGTTMLSHFADQRRTQDDLVEKSNIVARRISAEMLIGQRGAVQSVSGLLKRELNLAQIEISLNRPECLWPMNGDYCVISTKNSVTAVRKIPVIAEPYFVSVTSPAKSLWNFINPMIFLGSTLPIALMLGIGLLFQRLILQRYFLRPVRSLVETSRGEKDVMGHWPEEIRDISNRLYKTFVTRDEEVFSQIARGVIHDLRTLIHTPLTAVDLVEDSLGDTEKRNKRLEHLNMVCKQQLPKIKEIIDNTLDGSREILVNYRLAQVRTSLNGACKTLSDLSKSSCTEIVLENRLGDIAFAHDPVQLERAITNLVKNGIEACQEKPTTAQRMVAVTAEISGNHVQIDIEDSGPGLPVHPDRIFRAFKSTKTHGSGLGLVVCRKIVEAHGGRLVPGSSRKLGGARFCVEIPLDKGAV